MKMVQSLQTLLAGTTLLCALLITAFIGVRMSDVVTPVERARQRDTLQRYQATLNQYVSDATSDVLAIAMVLQQQIDLKALADAPRSEVARQLAPAHALLHAFIESKNHYAQLRLIGTRAPGYEWLRFQRSRPGQVVMRIPVEQLQRKGQRPYVRAGTALRDGELHLSELDLNHEHGALEKPLQSMLRVVTPLCYQPSECPTIVVLNLFMGPILDRLRTDQGLQIVNREGFYLLHPNRALEFGNSFDPGLTVANLDPKLASHLEQSAGAVDYVSNQRSVQVLPLLLADQSRGFLVHYTTLARNESLRATRTVLLVFAGCVSVLLAAVASFFARSLSRPLAELTEAAGAVVVGQPLRLPSGLRGELHTLGAALQASVDKLQAGNRELAAQERRFRQVFDTSPAGLLVVDGSGTIRLANEAAHLLFGYGPQELTGALVSDLLPSEAAEQHAAYLADYFKHPTARRMTSRADLAGTRKDGTRVSIEVGLSPLELDGRPAAIAAVTDVTESRRLVAELKRSNEDLERFAFISSHDLQQPIRLVLMYSQLLERTDADRLSDSGQAHLAVVRKAAVRMRELVQDLLVYSRVSARGGRSEAVDLNRVVEAASESLVDAIEQSGARLHIDRLPTVTGDGGLLRQVFQNLLANALKYHREGEPPVIHVSGHLDGAWATVTVSDRGIGIDPDKADLIFELFERLQNSSHVEGSGVGLSIVKRIIERHGGTISLASQLGQGATFSLSLPAHDVAVKQA